MLGEIVNVVSGIDKLAFISVYIAQARLGGNYSFEASLGYVGFTRHLPVPLSRCIGMAILILFYSIFISKNRTRSHACQRTAPLRRKHLNFKASSGFNHPSRRLARHCQLQKPRTSKISKQLILARLRKVSQESRRFVFPYFYSNPGPST